MRPPQRGRRVEEVYHPVAAQVEIASNTYNQSITFIFKR
jgi:hypothetical protein